MGPMFPWLFLHPGVILGSVYWRLLGFWSLGLSSSEFMASVMLRRGVWTDDVASQTIEISPHTTVSYARSYPHRAPLPPSPTVPPRRVAPPSHVTPCPPPCRALSLIAPPSTIVPHSTSPIMATACTVPLGEGHRWSGHRLLESSSLVLVN